MGAVAATAERLTDDDWQRRATAEAIAAVRGVVGDGINGRATIGSLGDVELGWMAAAAIFAWIKTRSQQAVAEGSSYELAIRDVPGEPAPWEAGAIETILPQLGSVQGVDWSKPVGEWQKPQIVAFAWQVYKLTDRALAARDEGAVDKIVRRIDPARVEREASALNGGPYMDRRELNDEIPF